jgi:hypothetical protein
MPRHPVARASVRLAAAAAPLALWLAVLPTEALAQICPAATPLTSSVSVHTNTDVSIYSVTPALSRWSAVGVRAEDGQNWNIEARDAPAAWPTCFSGLLANSSTTAMDFLVTDWRYRSLGTDYLGVGTGAGVGTSARVEFEQPTLEVRGNFPFDHLSTGPTDLLSCNEMQMFAGVPYHIRVIPSAGLTALRAFVFAPITSGTGWVTRADRAAETALVGGSENWLEFTPSVTGYHAIVIVNQDGASGDYWLAVGHCAFSSHGLEDGLPYHLNYLDEWPTFVQEAPSWGVTGVRGDPGYSYNLDLAPGLRSQDGTFTACTDSVLASQYSGIGTRVVAGDFGALPQRRYTAHANLEGQPKSISAGYIEWESGADTLVVNGGPLLVSPPANNVFDAWSVRLVAGASYDFLLTPAGGATASYGMLLFGNPSPGSAYWASRPDAVWQASGSGSFAPSATGLYGFVVVNDNGGTGGYSLSVTSAQIGVEPGVAAPAVSRIRSAAPNPTRGGARIAYELARRGRATLEIRDAAGRTVMAVTLGTRPAGAEEFAWDGLGAGGQRLPAGVYFLTLTLDGRTADRAKLTILR